jgi:hypothetical protein
VWVTTSRLFQQQVEPKRERDGEREKDRGGERERDIEERKTKR